MAVGRWRGALPDRDAEDKEGGSHRYPRIRNGVTSAEASSVQRHWQSWGSSGLGKGVGDGDEWGQDLGMWV